MPAAFSKLAFLAATVVSAQVTRNAPAYSAATIVNAASNDPNALAPYTIIKINGTNLAWDQKSIQPSDIRNSTVPSVLPNSGVHVYVNNQSAGVLAVSPTQITALISGDLVAGPASVWTSLDGLAGAAVTVNLALYGPALFANDDGTLIASRDNGDLITADSPLIPGGTVVLHAIGLGPADPPLRGLEIASSPLALDSQTSIVVYINDNPIDPAVITGIGFVPGQAGIYQITIQLPPDTPSNPEVRIEANGFKSPAGLKLWVNSNGPGPLPRPLPLLGKSASGTVGAGRRLIPGYSGARVSLRGDEHGVPIPQLLRCKLERCLDFTSYSQLAPRCSPDPTAVLAWLSTRLPPPSIATACDSPTAPRSPTTVPTSKSSATPMPKFQARQMMRRYTASSSTAASSAPPPTV